MMPQSQTHDARIQLRQMRRASLLEGCTLLLLLGIAVPLKHLAHLPLAVTVCGPIHGLAFVFYFWTLMGTIADTAWSRFDRIFMVVTAFVPFGAFACACLLAKREAALASPH